MRSRDFETVSRAALQAYFDTHGVVRHQIESFDHFADVMLRHIITENSDVHAETEQHRHRLRFTNVCIPQPSIREANGFVRTVQGPAEAMARNLSYASAVLVDVLHTVVEKDGGGAVKSDLYREVALCKLPVMVRS
jgi:DNA-directed RNA polymerase II subunit RPB2